MQSMAGRTGLISIVIPVFNEAESLTELSVELRGVADTNRLNVEIIFVDDGSRDRSWQVIQQLAALDGRMRGIRLRRNFGKAAALAAGFAAAAGDVVFQLDGDLQDDPAEIPNFLSALDAGDDVVNGWKRQRQDPWHKVWPSMVFNRMVSLMSRLKLHDHNCGFKCFRSQVVKELRLYGELHRFIPVMAHAHGFRVTELPVHHRPRRHGQSKYGFPRFFKGFLDLMTVTFLTGFGQRPLHLLGGIGLIAFLLGSIGLGYLSVGWLLARLEVCDFGPIGQRPLLIYSVAGLLLGFQMLAIGFLAELIIASNMNHQPSYHVAERTAEPVTEGAAS